MTPSEPRDPRWEQKLALRMQMSRAYLTTILKNKGPAVVQAKLASWRKMHVPGSCYWNKTYTKSYHGPCFYCNGVIAAMEEEFGEKPAIPVLVQPQPLWVNDRGTRFYVPPEIHHARRRENQYYDFIFVAGPPAKPPSERYQIVESWFKGDPANPRLIHAIQWYQEALVPWTRTWDDDLGKIPGWTGEDYVEVEVTE